MNTDTAVLLLIAEQYETICNLRAENLDLQSRLEQVSALQTEPDKNKLAS